MKKNYKLKSDPKISDLIKKLQAVKKAVGDIEVIKDFDDDGWFGVEELNVINCDGKSFLSIDHVQ